MLQSRNSWLQFDHLPTGPVAIDRLGEGIIIQVTLERPGWEAEARIKMERGGRD